MADTGRSRHAPAKQALFKNAPSMMKDIPTRSAQAEAEPVRFAIAIPVGAWHDSLSATFESLAIQDPKPDVALLDASGDPRVATLADSFAGLFSYRRHGPDAGQTAAIAEGWAALEGDVLNWLNMDDALMPGALAAVARAFEENPEADIVYGHSTVLDEEGALRGAHPAVDPARLDDLPRDCVISQPSCFTRRHAVERAGGLNDHFHYVMDWDLWTRLYRTGAKFHYIDAYLSQVVWAKQTKTADFNLRKLGEMFEIVGRTRRPDWIAKTLLSAGRQILIDYHLRPVFTRRPFYWRKDARLPYVNFASGEATGLVIALQDGGDAAAGALEVHDERAAPIVNGAWRVTRETGEDLLTLGFKHAVPRGEPVWISAADTGLLNRIRRICWAYDAVKPAA